ncbi:RecB family exonuclease [Thermodesulfobacteriota bacterium]
MNAGQLPEHLSYSSVSTYMQCSLKWRFHYVDRLEPEFTPSALLFGQAIHEAIGAFLQSTLNGDRLTADNLLDVYRQIWISHEGPSIRYGARDSEDALLTKAEGLLSLFHEQHDPSSEVIAVEEAFELDLQELVPDYPHKLPHHIGVVDSIQKQNGVTSLIDYKTAARKPNGSVNAMQLVAYSIGAAGLGYDPNELDYRYEYLVKTAKPQLVSYPVKVNDRDRRRFLKMATRVWKAVQGAIFYPNPSFFCSGCGFQRHCNEW